MINHLSALELMNVAAKGGSVEVDGGRYSALDLMSIASKLAGGAYLKVHNSGSKTSLEMMSIAAKRPGSVIFA